MKKMLKKVTVFLLAMAVIITMLPLTSSDVKAATPKLNYTRFTLSTRESVTLKLTGATKKPVWSSSNKEIATVSNGKVTAKKRGLAVITARIGSDKFTCKVSVRTDYKVLYKKQLESLASNPYLKGYYVLDIDKNGLPDLITGICGNGRTTYDVYTIKKGRLINAGSVSSAGSYSPVPVFRYMSKYKGFHICGGYNFSGIAYDCLYRLSGSSLKEARRAENHSTEKTYYTGSDSAHLKKVSKSAYNSFVKTYLSGYRTYKMLPNTAANRAKSFR